MGDGNYKWWVGYAEDDESFLGPYETRDEAIAEGRGNYGDDETFYIVEADKSVIRANIDGSRYADSIMDDLCERNEECFGENGPDDAWAHIADAHKTLGDAVESAVAAWLEANPGKTWAFGDMRNGEYIEAVKEAAA